jgi:phosphatidylglycerol:prolipoprotein diacylglycerol transferase
LGLLVLHARKRFDGQVVLAYFMAYPIIRSVTEIFRGDLIRGFVIDEVLSTSQFISLLVFLASLVILKWRLGKLDGPGESGASKK